MPRMASLSPRRSPSRGRRRSGSFTGGGMGMADSSPLRHSLRGGARGRSSSRGPPPSPSPASPPRRSRAEAGAADRPPPP